MSTISHETPTAVPERRSWSAELFGRDMWAGIAIAVIWLAVLFTAIFGPDIVSHDVSGTDTTIPSVIVVALFAWFATIAVAKYGFRRDRDGG